MKYLLPLFIVAFFSFPIFSQYSVSTQGLPSNADLRVSINTSTANAKLKIKIGQNLNTYDFSIGFTDNPPDADLSIFDSNVDLDLSIVKTRLSNSDISVVYGEEMMNPNIRIEVIEEGSVDYLIYYETQEFNIESVLIGILPLINAHLEYSYEAIPYYGTGDGSASEPEEENMIIQPIVYQNMDVAHWIISLHDGIIQLDDEAFFYVYDEDRYIVQQWQVKNDVVVSPTTMDGHYYITKDGGIYKEAETLRAICFRPE